MRAARTHSTGFVLSNTSLVSPAPTLRMPTLPIAVLSLGGLSVFDLHMRDVAARDRSNYDLSHRVGHFSGEPITIFAIVQDA